MAIITAALAAAELMGVILQALFGDGMPTSLRSECICDGVPLDHVLLDRDASPIWSSR